MVHIGRSRSLEESHEESRKKIGRGGIVGKRSEKEILAAPFTKALPDSRPAASCRRESRLVMPQRKRNKDRQEGRIHHSMTLRQRAFLAGARGSDLVGERLLLVVLPRGTLGTLRDRSARRVGTE